MPELLKAKSVATKCKHHWRIKPAAGETSDARCLLCGDERTYRNYDERTTYVQPRNRLASQ